MGKPFGPLKSLVRGRAFVLFTLVVGSAVTTAILTAPSASPPSDEATARKEPLQWGIYQILWSPAYPAQLENELSKFASKPDYVMFYRDLDRPFPRFAAEAINAQDATPVVSLELWSWHGGRHGSYLPAIVSGKYDAALREWAVQAKAYGKRVLLRFGFEFNGDWFTWSQDPKAYIAAWRHAHAIFQVVGAMNVEWVWTPNVVSCPDKPENDMHLYYPGDDVVHWVGVDGYNFGDEHDQWHKWQTFEQIFDSVLADFRTRYPEKPLMITEFGCAPGPADLRALWIREAHRFLARQPQVKAVIWFNYDKRREKEPNFRIDATPGALDAFNATFAAP